MGQSTLFVRLGGCDLRCRWCDSVHTWSPAAECRIETRRGSGVFESVENPVGVDAVVAAAETLDLPAHRFVSLTGGEPLLQPDAVRALAEALGGRGPRIHLETHGLAVDAFERVAAAIDHVAMDWKLTSDVRRASDRRGPVAEFHERHARFLAVAARESEVEVKVVVTPSSRDDEIEALCAHVERIAPETPLIIQPVTPCGPVSDTPPAERLLEILVLAGRHLADVRVIPQTHKQIGAL